MNAVFGGLLPTGGLEGWVRLFESLDCFVVGCYEEGFQRFDSVIRASRGACYVTLAVGLANLTPCESAIPDEETGTCNHVLPLHR